MRWRYKNNHFNHTGIQAICRMSDKELKFVSYYTVEHLSGTAEKIILTAWYNDFNHFFIIRKNFMVSIIWKSNADTNFVFIHRYDWTSWVKLQINQQMGEGITESTTSFTWSILWIPWPKCLSKVATTSFGQCLSTFF